MQREKIANTLMSAGIAGLFSLLTACGGGGSSGTTSNPGGGTPTNTGTVNMAMTDAPSDVFNHVWVTVTAIAFHTDPNKAWSASDASWQTITLSTPVTLDLASLNNGAMNNVFASMNLPVGTYKQIRFFFASDSDPLQTSAQATLDNQSSAMPLQWNDQVEYIGASGTVWEAPLEISDLVQGMQLLGTFNVTADVTLNLVTDFNLEKIISPFYQITDPIYGTGYQAFTMKSDLSYFDLANSGGVTGYVGDTSAAQAICEPTYSAPCTGEPFHVIVHAEAISSDGTRYEAVRSTAVDPVTGQFTLAPLALTDSSGAPLIYDIVVRGRQTQTRLIPGVTPTGAYAGTTLSGVATLSTKASPLSVTYSSEYSTQFSTPLSPLTAGHVVFEQTPCVAAVACASYGLPHEIRWVNTNPLTGEISSLDRSGLAPWAQSFNLVTASLIVPAYASIPSSGGAPTNAEGAGNYSVIANEKAYYDFSLVNTLNWISPATSEALSLANLPTLSPSVQNGTVTGTISVGTSGQYVSGDLIVARFGQVITSMDISTELAASGSYNYSVTNLGAGSASNEVGGAYYYVYVRLINASGRWVIIPASGFIDMRTTNQVSDINVSV